MNDQEFYQLFQALQIIKDLEERLQQMYRMETGRRYVDGGRAPASSSTNAIGKGG